MIYHYHHQYQSEKLVKKVVQTKRALITLRLTVNLRYLISYTEKNSVNYSPVTSGYCAPVVLCESAYRTLVH